MLKEPPHGPPRTRPCRPATTALAGSLSHHPPALLQSRNHLAEPASMSLDHSFVRSCILLLVFETTNSKIIKTCKTQFTPPDPTRHSTKLFHRVSVGGMNWTVTLNVLIRLLPTVADSVYTARRDATKHFRRVAASCQAV